MLTEPPTICQKGGVGLGWGGGRSHADIYLLSDRVDTCLTSAIWLYRQQEFEGRDHSMKELMNQSMTVSIST